MDVTYGYKNVTLIGSLKKQWTIILCITFLSRGTEIYKVSEIFCTIYINRNVGL